jgi:hypothetical protein
MEIGNCSTIFSNGSVESMGHISKGEFKADPDIAGQGV